mmetsp:Transcript_8367/g.18285  ORF Transcript_8367/g.18285 Transcript_8367/m.18285 type:complete len:323 (-) Transcript_8367:169-1137(-)
MSKLHGVSLLLTWLLLAPTMSEARLRGAKKGRSSADLLRRVRSVDLRRQHGEADRVVAGDATRRDCADPTVPCISMPATVPGVQSSGQLDLPWPEMPVATLTASSQVAAPAVSASPIPPFEVPQFETPAPLPEMVPASTYPIQWLPMSTAMPVVATALPTVAAPVTAAPTTTAYPTPVPDLINNVNINVGGNVNIVNGDGGPYGYNSSDFTHGSTAVPTPQVTSSTLPTTVATTAIPTTMPVTIALPEDTYAAPAAELKIEADAQPVDCAVCAVQFVSNGGCPSILAGESLAGYIPSGCADCSVECRNHCLHRDESLPPAWQ